MGIINNGTKPSNRKGSVLVYVLIIFLIIVTITSTVAFLFTSNLRMAGNQEENLRAHYLALSGVDITISTLLSRVAMEEGEEIIMADKIKNGNEDVQLTDEIDIEGEIVEIEVNYNKEKKNFTINSKVNTKKNIEKELSLEITFSGNQYKKIWK